jgi:hypothetical protein
MGLRVRRLTDPELRLRPWLGHDVLNLSNDPRGATPPAGRRAIQRHEQVKPGRRGGCRYLTAVAERRAARTIGRASRDLRPPRGGHRPATSTASYQSSPLALGRPEGTVKTRSTRLAMLHA